jgi:hypothetical protein
LRMMNDDDVFSTGTPPPEHNPHNPTSASPIEIFSIHRSQTQCLDEQYHHLLLAKLVDNDHQHPLQRNNCSQQPPNHQATSHPTMISLP